MNKLPYDDANIKDIFRYSTDLIEQSFVDVLSRIFKGKELDEKTNYYNNPKAKGGLGNLLEEHYFFTSLIVTLYQILIRLEWN
ncbi:hypothetical protein ACJA23_02885 [Mycoplasma corogypsi]|uniref:hypothetical protein n=1 Tax=Mycoplasma corogypsi TaxID=2106 RepID=UPI003872E8BC